MKHDEYLLISPCFFFFGNSQGESQIIDPTNERLNPSTSRERERPVYTEGKITCTCRVRTVQGLKHGVMGESGIPKLMGYPYILSVKIAQN